MSIASYSIGEDSLAAHVGAPPTTVRKPPKKRQITARPDATESPEPR